MRALVLLVGNRDMYDNRPAQRQFKNWRSSSLKFHQYDYYLQNSRLFFRIPHSLYQSYYQNSSNYHYRTPLEPCRLHQQPPSNCWPLWSCSKLQPRFQHVGVCHEPFSAPCVLSSQELGPILSSLDKLLPSAALPTLWTPHLLSITTSYTPTFRDIATSTSLKTPLGTHQL